MKFYAFVINNTVMNTVVADTQPEGHDGGVFIEYDNDGEIRYNPAVKGGTYNPESDAFIDPQPFISWTLNTENFKWEAPVAKPEGFHRWDEDTLSWIAMA